MDELRELAAALAEGLLTEDEYGELRLGAVARARG